MGKAAKQESFMQMDLFTYLESVKTSIGQEKQSQVKPKCVRRNYVLDEHAVGSRSDQQKVSDNVQAIRSLKELQAGVLQPDPQVLEHLTKYCGWGGLSGIFTQKKFSAQHKEVKSLLTDKEYADIKGSTLTAFYTPPAIIKYMYKILSNMGFTKGNILEPGCGTGNFIGMMPKSMRESKFYGVELDAISAKMAQYLYPDANIKIGKFEQTGFTNDFFDVVVGNIPFGQYRIYDPEYQGLNFLVHDYFIAKAMDKVRAGGIVILITSKGTLDKKDDTARRYFAERANLLGAIRLPDHAFKDYAGTNVTADILIFQKKDRIAPEKPEWLYSEPNRSGVSYNRYFKNHPQMVLGTLETKSGPYGPEVTCKAGPGEIWEDRINNLIPNIPGKYSVPVITQQANLPTAAADTIPAVEEVPNYSYAIVNQVPYYRENSLMRKVTRYADRISALIKLREILLELINGQLQECNDQQLANLQTELGKQYDSFVKKYGIINSRCNRSAFSDDSGYFLLCSLEILKDDQSFDCKADIFTKRTIQKAEPVKQVDTAHESLTVSLNTYAYVNLPFMSKLTNKSEERLIKELRGTIFMDPVTEKWLPADEYLSGDVRQKLDVANVYAGIDSKYKFNVESLIKVQPKDLKASDIYIRLGANWIKPGYIDEFITEVLGVPKSYIERGMIQTYYHSISNDWSVDGKDLLSSNSILNFTYGTQRISGLQLLDKILNQREIKVTDPVYDSAKGRYVYVTNRDETILANQKADDIIEAFKDWIFKDFDRRNSLVELYNCKFNSIRPRTYDGSFLTFPGKNPTVKLYDHQINGIARQILGKNTLLAHCVGSGKTFTMIAAAMEMKRLGLAQKPLFVVPSNLVGQWAKEFLKLYPGANLLASTKKDFIPANRKKFCSRIATNNYDAVIIGHSQFEKIPISKERQEHLLDEEREVIVNAITKSADIVTTKRLELLKKNLETKMAKLNDIPKDHVITFEQLGVDRLFIDESHNYKNLFFTTKMGNIAGVSTCDSKRSFDILTKCRYIDEVTGGSGITFATGTPLSNSMSELYTIMRYLSFDLLKEKNIEYFDDWAANFGECVTAIELSPTGNGYRAKKRFARFYNIPELITLFHECADVQTKDMLDLDTPTAEYFNMETQPSTFQKKALQELSSRAEAVHNKSVDPKIDNMLKITTDGRKLALDQRLLNKNLPDYYGKTSKCAEEVYRIYMDTAAKSAAQIVFCDTSTPAGQGFNVYGDLKKKLIAYGVAADEIAFIHDAKSDLQKAALHSKVKSGRIRVLVGSTTMVGVGTNIQERLIALHHLDVPWRPLDIEQREGRILRQGNIFEKVYIYRYLTKGTFDAYSWQIIENKQRFIGQIITGKAPSRSIDDIDEGVLNYAEIKALASDNPLIQEKTNLDIEVAKLKIAKANFVNNKYRLEQEIAIMWPNKIDNLTEMIKGYEKDMDTFAAHKTDNSDEYRIYINGQLFTQKDDVGTVLRANCDAVTQGVYNEKVRIGKFMGFELYTYRSLDELLNLVLEGENSYRVALGQKESPRLYISLLLQRLTSLADDLSECRDSLVIASRNLADANIEVKRTFRKEVDLQRLQRRLNEVNEKLHINNSSVVA